MLHPARPGPLHALRDLGGGHQPAGVRLLTHTHHGHPGCGYVTMEILDGGILQWRYWIWVRYYGDTGCGYITMDILDVGMLLWRYWMGGTLLWASWMRVRYHGHLDRDALLWRYWMWVCYCRDTECGYVILVYYHAWTPWMWVR